MISTGEEIRIAFNILQASDQNYSATIDVPDQGANGIPVSLWVGPLEIEGGEEIRALFEISSDNEGAYTAEFGVPDQNAMGLPVEKIPEIIAPLALQTISDWITKRVDTN